MNEEENKCVETITAGMTRAQKAGFSAASLLGLRALVEASATPETAIGAMQGLAYVAGCCVAGSTSDPGLAALLRKTFETAAAQPNMEQHELTLAALKVAS